MFRLPMRAPAFVLITQTYLHQWDLDKEFEQKRFSESWFWGEKREVLTMTSFQLLTRIRKQRTPTSQIFSQMNEAKEEAFIGTA